MESLNDRDLVLFHLDSVPPQQDRDRDRSRSIARATLSINTNNPSISTVRARGMLASVTVALADSALSANVHAVGAGALVEGQAAGLP